MLGKEQYSYRKDKAVPSFSDEGPIFDFDGQCVFCSGWVKFALKHDKSGKYRFMTAQSEVGSALYRHYGLDDRDHKTNLFLQDGRAFLRAEGTIRLVAASDFPGRSAAFFVSSRESGWTGSMNSSRAIASGSRGNGRLLHSKAGRKRPIHPLRHSIMRPRIGGRRLSRHRPAMSRWRTEQDGPALPLNSRPGPRSIAAVLVPASPVG